MRTSTYLHIHKMSKRLIISQEEKNRILNLHETRKNKEWNLISEDDTVNSQKPNDEVLVHGKDKDYDYKKVGDKYYFKLKPNPVDPKAQGFKKIGKFKNWTLATNKAAIDAISKLPFLSTVTAFQAPTNVDGSDETFDAPVPTNTDGSDETFDAPVQTKKGPLMGTPIVQLGEKTVKWGDTIEFQFKDLKNSGTAPLTISKITPSSENMTVDTKLPLILQPGQTFSPKVSVKLVEGGTTTKPDQNGVIKYNTTVLVDTDGKKSRYTLYCRATLTIQK